MRLAMGRKHLRTGPLTRQAVRDSLARFYSRGARLSPADREALNGFRFSGAPDSGALTGTELFDAYGVPKNHPQRQSNFFQNVNCGSGVIRR